VLGLGQDDPYFDPTTGNDVFNPTTDLPVASDINLSPTPAGWTPSNNSGGSLSPSELNLISSAITTGGALANKALTPTPTVTYNPATGQYTATGGAALPSSLTSGLGSLTAYLPILLLGGGLLLVVSAMKK
jgi:hypothetical protein